MHPIQIFLVEDNEGDIVLIQEGFEDAKIHVSMTVARDGAEAIKKLQKIATEEAGQLPDLILLDINLPKKNGHEVLEVVKNDPNLKKIPIIVLTTSTSDLDVCKAYDLHANCYIVKPIEIGEFIKVVTRIEDFWLTVVKLPKKSPHEEG